MRRGYASAILICLAAVFVFAPRAYAAPVVTVRNVDGALFADAGTHYEMSATSDYITFEVVADGVPDGLELFFRVSVAGGSSSSVSSVFPTTRGALRDGAPSAVSVSLAPNNSGSEARAELLITFEYGNSNELPPPRTVTVQIMQRSSQAQPTPPPGLSTENISDELAIVAMLESTVVMPEVMFMDRTALLTYRTGGMVSWDGGSGSDTQITIRDVSALSADMPLMLEDYRPTINGVLSNNRYTVTIPAIQMAYVLEKRADEIADSLRNNTLLIEDFTRSTGGITYLVPSLAVELPPGTTIFTDIPYVDIPNDQVLAITADTVWLASAVGRDLEIILMLLYNDVPSSRTLRMNIQLSRLDMYPSVVSELGLDSLLDSDIIAPESNDEQGLRESSAQSFNGLTQIFDGNNNVFIQRLNANWSFTSNIPNGLVTNNSVSFSFPQEMEFELKRDDEYITYSSGANIYQPGVYLLRVRVNEIPNAPATVYENLTPSQITLEDILNMQNTSLDELLDAAAAGDIAVYEAEFRFRIVSGMTNSLVFYNPPPGYRIAGLRYQDIPVTDFSPRYVHLIRDGSYKITAAGNPGEPEFETEVVRFTTRPLIFLDSVENGGSTAAAVTYFSESSGAGIADVEVVLDNARIFPNSNTLSEPGLYQIIATDNAGNSASVSFQILYSVNISGWMVVTVFILVFGLITGTMFYLRTHMRVR